MVVATKSKNCMEKRGEEALEIQDDGEAERQIVTPWKVEAKDGNKIDYDKLVNQFGCQRLDQSLIDRGTQTHTKYSTRLPPPRGLLCSPGLQPDSGMDSYEKGDKFYLYTGRGPSSESLHLGHLIPFMFTKYLQDAFKVPLVIQLTDDENCMWPEKSHRGRKPKTCEGEC